MTRQERLDVWRAEASQEYRAAVAHISAMSDAELPRWCKKLGLPYLQAEGPVIGSGVEANPCVS